MFNTYFLSHPTVSRPMPMLLSVSYLVWFTFSNYGQDLSLSRSNALLMGDTSQRGEPNGERSGETEQVSELLDVLANRRRRYAVYCLHTFATPMALADVTDEIVRFEMDTEPTTVPDVRKQVYTDLYHRHLPKLAAVEIVKFDTEENLVDVGPDADMLKPYLEQLCDEDWSPETFELE